MRALLVIGVALGLAAPLASAAFAQTCAPEQIAAVIDETGARLRKLTSENQPRQRARLKELAQKRGWSDADLESKGREFVQDQHTRELDERAGGLLVKLDRLGDVGQGDGQSCTRLEDARSTAAQLIEVTNEKAAHVAARIEAALKVPAAGDQAAAPQAPAAQPKATQPPARPSEPKAAAAAPPAARPQAAPPQPQPQQQAGTWGTATVREATPDPAAMEALPRPVDPGDLGFSPEEIRDAGRGFFGSISAGLASVIDYAFRSYGKPVGYILGNEGGGAFLAGLRYGDGTAVTKAQGERKVFWQGPSVGYDFGLAGSRVMFLVYNTRDLDQLYSRFIGVDGSAYIVGGVGITFLKKGNIVLAPIRTGLGLRVGANVGYLKFTPEPSINPF